MNDDPEYLRLARRETAERLRRMRLAAQQDVYDEVYRQAHTLAGIALDARLAAGARDVARLLRDEAGRPLALSEADATRIREEVARLTREHNQHQM